MLTAAMVFIGLVLFIGMFASSALISRCAHEDKPESGCMAIGAFVLHFIAAIVVGVVIFYINRSVAS